MSIVFFGSSKYSAIVEKALHEKFGLSLVVTISDRPVGNPVKQFAQINNIPFITPDKLDQTIINEIKDYKPNFLVVADYGLILPKKLLELPKYAPLNVHHSLLPKYRGPSPAPTAILNGDKTTGVTIIKMTEEVDAGAILAQKEYQLKPDETTDSLLTELNKLGGQLLIKVINKYLKGEIKEVAQNEKDATYTNRMTKQNGFFDLDNPPPPEVLKRMIRAYYPWPSVWTRFKIHDSRFMILKFLPNQKLQVEGKNPMSYKDFVNGYKEGKEILQKLKLL